ncbi:uncharacterized protein IL334_002021 [Kwoniella shivajii]|uniref:DASH complex subunit DUO1 n=1 Tax=Kwoniella shivajii TaxID=564305 RepID=A0ABZ1CTJ6_9TREE|nr:hypothetical protein IL334_002021 [Kwoniella shivajii]
MDSPLLPQFNRKSLIDESLLVDPDSSLLADLSLGDIPSSPNNSSSYHVFTGTGDQRQRGEYGLGNSLGSSSTSSTTTTTSSAIKGDKSNIPNQHRKVNIDHQLDDYDDRDEDNDTPIKTKITKQNDNNSNNNNNNNNNQKPKPRFSLFAAPRPPSSEDIHDQREDGHEHDQEGDEEGDDQTIHGTSGQMIEQEEASGSGSGMRQRQTTVEKEDKLRSSLYELRKMNEVFEGVIGALEGVRGHNQRLADRVQQTSALLDEYTSIMGQAEHTQKLLMNPKWTGSSDDAEAIQAAEQARVLSIQRAEENSRRVAESARLAEEERERRSLEREKSDSSRGRGRGRGVGVRGGGVASGVPTAARGRGTGIPRPSVAPSRPPTTGIKRGSGTGTTNTNTMGTSTGGGGLGGQYSHVKSSGYGPR